MSSRKHFLIALAIIAITSSVPVVLSANQYYMGAYFDGTADTTNIVIFNCNYQDTDPNDIPAGGNLIGVLSVNGGDDTTPGKYNYQNPFFLYQNGSVFFIPQYWKIDVMQNHTQCYAGDHDYIYFYGRTNFKTATNKIEYKAYIYPNEWSVDHDTPVIKTWSHSAPAEDDNFIVGDQEYQNQHFYSCQVGVEAKLFIGEAVKLRCSQFGYKDGANWKYMPARSRQGYTSFITYNGTHYGTVGGITYLGMNIDSSSTSNDIVTWEWNGTTLGNDVSLWSGSGNVVKNVDVPFN